MTRTALKDRWVVPAFAGATFLGALLLFLVQPLIAKYILPWFGGGPTVWTACLLFFQTVLLAGYAYAHASAQRLSPRSQARVHIALLVAAVVVALRLCAQPPSQPRAEAGASELAPVGQILLLLAMTVGLPCFALSATSPLLNAWHARATAAPGARAYRLYAVSNAGSLLALVAYPFGVEPALSRRAQWFVFAGGLVAFAALCGWCAMMASRHPAASAPSERDGNRNDGAVRTRVAARVMWLLLPACASVLLLATTNMLTHDLAPVPLLWVLPLALYLLTFILAFDARRWYRRGLIAAALPVAAAGVCAVLLGADGWLSTMSRVALLAGAMFVCCMACHGELAALSPPPQELTAYYLTIAAGGAAGGLLVAVVAPLVLDRYAELHIGLWVCCALVLVAPYATSMRRVKPVDATGSEAVSGPDVAGGASPRETGSPAGLLAMFGVAGLVVLAAVLWAARDPYPFAGGKPAGRWRDFYGVVTLYAAHADDPDRAALLFRHAGVTHGMQFLSPVKRRDLTTYFGKSSGIGLALRCDAPPAGPRRVGVVGLGAGTLAAYGRPGDTFRFYEISPTVARIARERFTFLADSDARCEVVTGDGRLALEREPAQRFDALALDAFSGHAIPYHLLTAEAFSLYRRHVAPGGVVAVNVSNRYVDIQSVVAQQAARIGWTALLISSPDGDDRDGLLGADWVLLTDNPALLADYRSAGGVEPRVDPDLRLWTDEYVSLYSVLRR